MSSHELVKPRRTDRMKWRTRVAYKLLPPHTLGQIRSDWAMTHRRWRNSRRHAMRQLAGSNGLRLHFGCGLRTMAGWVNIDAFEYRGVDLRWDLRDPLPCEAGVAEMIYCEHVLEHLEYDDALGVLREFSRLLGPGGWIRLGVPDACLYMQAYVRHDESFFRALANIGNPVIPLDTPIKVINQMFRMGGAHRFAWDFETLAQEVAAAGFTSIVQRVSGHSDEAELCLDDVSHAAETLYVEARKPAATGGHSR